MIGFFLVLDILVSAYNLDIVTYKENLIATVQEGYYVEPMLQGMYATTAVNIRSEPDASAKKLGFLLLNDKITVTGKCSNDWYRVDYNGETAYVAEKYLSNTKTFKEDYEGSSDLPSFVYNDGVATSYITEVLNQYYLVDDKVRQRFEAFGSRLVITDKDLGLKFYNKPDSRVLACTQYNIENKTCSIYVGEMRSSSVIHELGHFLDYNLGTQSNSSEFRAIWGSDVEKFRGIYETALENTSTSSEYFAESFEAFTLEPVSLQISCPQTYNYFKDLLEEVL